MSTEGPGKKDAPPIEDDPGMAPERLAELADLAQYLANMDKLASTPPAGRA